MRFLWQYSILLFIFYHNNRVIVIYVMMMVYEVNWSQWSLYTIFILHVVHGVGLKQVILLSVIFCRGLLCLSSQHEAFAFVGYSIGVVIVCDIVPVCRLVAISTTSVDMFSYINRFAYRIQPPSTSTATIAITFSRIPMCSSYSFFLFLTHHHSLLDIKLLLDIDDIAIHYFFGVKQWDAGGLFVNKLLLFLLLLLICQLDICLINIYVLSICDNIIWLDHW